MRVRVARTPTTIGGQKGIGRLRVFEMHRGADETGVSGTGKVGEGVQFTDGSVVFRWQAPGKPQSTVTYNRLEDFMAIHVDPHPGNGTLIRWCHAVPDDELLPPPTLAMRERSENMGPATRRTVVGYLEELDGPGE
jgi:hypothetical protein